MKHSEIIGWNDPLARTASIIGERWTLLVLRQFFLGLHNFSDIQVSLGVARNILTERLNRLVAEDILERREREYWLTEKGHDLYQVIGAMLEWGDQYMMGEEGPPVRRIHKLCGKPTRAQLTCQACGERIEARDVHVEHVEDTPYAHLGTLFTQAQELVTRRKAKKARSESRQS